KQGSVPINHKALLFLFSFFRKYKHISNVAMVQILHFIINQNNDSFMPNPPIEAFSSFSCLRIKFMSFS
ncbi:hypothetical protein P4605_23500, partial [Priestia aryabhattai]|uniref:hypothetical protein n=1 Tax=Priestia aryabhattai TaxID=412384 RepID=UPI002E1C249A|nr:hypothetical protein [Priestia aryabhattai]